MVGGTPVGELAKSLKPGGSIVVYAMQSAQFPAISPKDFIYRGLSLHGFWLINWIRNAPRTEIQEIYQKLGDLVSDGSLSAAVEQVYPLEQFKEAFEKSLKSNRSGKILFKFGATDPRRKNMATERSHSASKVVESEAAFSRAEENAKGGHHG
jgi:NADPH:quinone reductase-like Zn-dependent oxidoreductase